WTSFHWMGSFSEAFPGQAPARLPNAAHTTGSNRLGAKRNQYYCPKVQGPYKATHGAAAQDRERTTHTFRYRAFPALAGFVLGWLHRLGHPAVEVNQRALQKPVQRSQHECRQIRDVLRLPQP